MFSKESITMNTTIRLIVIAATLLFTVWPAGLIAQDRRLERAEKAFELRQYHEAIDLYQRAYNRVRRNDRAEATRLIFQIALCHRYTNNHRMAEAWFNRAVRANYPDPVAVLYLADAMMTNEKFDQALENYQRFAELAPDDWRGPHGIASVELARELMENPTPYQVEAVRLFNSRRDDFTPAFADHRASSLIFASSRDDALGRNSDPWTGNQHTSFFITYQDRAGDWDRPSLLDEGPINTEYNEGAPSINAQATEMFFTRCLRSEDTDMGCRIFRAQREGANWGSPREVRLTTDSLVTLGHPAISPDGMELYFVTNMPGSLGERDIWVARRPTPNGEFTNPEHLGKPVNTPGNEMFPFVREDGTLFFASDGHPGLGGLDIFVSSPSPDGWSQPENLGVPINSPADDFGIVFRPGREEGFLSSNRGRTGAYDIYSFGLQPLEFMISGVVRDDTTKTPVPDALVQLIGSGGSIHQVETGRDGSFVFDRSVVRENTVYEILVNKSGYFAGRERVSTIGYDRSHDLEQDVHISPIPVTAIELPEILYEFASWELQPQFKDSLNGLVRTMLDNPNIVVELASHTDSRGTHDYNDTLSQRRAQSVVDYLVAEGIENERLQARGYGKRRPRVIERTIEREGFVFEAGTELTEAYIESLPEESHRDAAHQLNRRTEFRVLRDDYDPPEPPGGEDRENEVRGRS